MPEHLRSDYTAELTMTPYPQPHRDVRPHLLEHDHRDALGQIVRIVVALGRYLTGTTDTTDDLAESPAVPKPLRGISSLLLERPARRLPGRRTQPGFTDHFSIRILSCKR